MRATVPLIWNRWWVQEGGEGCLGSTRCRVLLFEAENQVDFTHSRFFSILLEQHATFQAFFPLSLCYLSCWRQLSTVFHKSPRFFSFRAVRDFLHEILCPHASHQTLALSVFQRLPFITVFCRGRISSVGTTSFLFLEKFFTFHLFTKHIHGKAAASTARWLICKAKSSRFIEVIFQSYEPLVFQKVGSIPRRKLLVVITWEANF